MTEATCDRPDFTVAPHDGASENRIHLLSVTFEAGKDSGKAKGSVHIGTTIGNAHPRRSMRRFYSNSRPLGR